MRRKTRIYEVNGKVVAATRPAEAKRRVGAEQGDRCRQIGTAKPGIPKGVICARPERG